MSYLTSDEFESIADTVTIFPVTSAELGDISQYSFYCGEAKEYETFLMKKAILLDKLAVTKTFVIIHILNIIKTHQIFIQKTDLLLISQEKEKQVIRRLV